MLYFHCLHIIVLNPAAPLQRRDRKLQAVSELLRSSLFRIADGQEQALPGRTPSDLLKRFMIVNYTVKYH